MNKHVINHEDIFLNFFSSFKEQSHVWCQNGNETPHVNWLLFSLWLGVDHFILSSFLIFSHWYQTGTDPEYQIDPSLHGPRLSASLPVRYLHEKKLLSKRKCEQPSRGKCLRNISSRHDPGFRVGASIAGREKADNGAVNQTGSGAPFTTTKALSLSNQSDCHTAHCASFSTWNNVYVCTQTAAITAAKVWLSTVHALFTPQRGAVSFIHRQTFSRAEPVRQNESGKSSE